MREVSLLSPAKLNLGLLVKEKREDGYHRIETIFVPINLFDEITISQKGRGIRVYVDKKGIPTGKENIVYRAAHLFYQNLGKIYGTEIYLRNRIPPGRGLGGASSDAATTLLGLNLLLAEAFPMGKLRKMAEELGSDCPFFLNSRPSYATGRGEVLAPIKMPRLKFFLHLPKIKISTAWAYSQFDEKLTKTDSSLIILKEKLEKGEIRGIRRYLVNDLERVVFRKYRKLSFVKERINHYTLGAQMTGSGSGIYGIVSRKGKKVVLRKLREEGIKGILVSSLTDAI